jgi:putative ABC transport system permease protein
VPGEWKNIDQILAAKEGGAESEAQTMFFMCIDQDFLRTFEMSLAAGRNLSDEMGTDTSAVIINEAAAQALGWEDPLGREIRVQDRPYRARVVGVVKDFHFQSLHEKIAPLVLGHWNNPVANIDYFTARVQAAEVPQTLASMQKIHEQFDQATPFEYNFLDDRLSDFYQTDVLVGKIFGISAGLTILIACLGLFGLASFTVEQRTKEVGIRKVLGASVGGIVGLMSKDFARLVLLANVVAWPVAYFAMNKWLGDFAYRIDLGVGTFAFAGGLALLIALLTVIVHAMKAALANPVEALRYE